MKIKPRFYPMLFGCIWSIHTLSAQVFDTIYHSNVSHSTLNFYLADTAKTAFKVSSREIKILDKDTTLDKMEFDTFFVQRIGGISEPGYIYSMSNKKWKSIVLGNNCDAFKNFIGPAPEFQLHRLKDKKGYVFENCSKNAAVIHAALLKYMECIESREDQSMKQYVKECMKMEADCEFQTSLFLQDLGHITSLANMPVPVAESTLCYSISRSADTTGLHTIHYCSHKKEDAGKKTISWEEDQTRSDPVAKKLVSGMYDIFKSQLSPEEQHRDSIRMASRKDEERTTLVIDKKDNFLRYERYHYSSMLNADMKLKESAYYHTIEVLGER